MGDVGRPRVDVDERSRGGGHDEPEAQQRERGADRDRAVDRVAAVLALDLEAEDARGAQEERLQDGHDHRDRQRDDADAEEQQRPLGVHARGGREDLAPGAPPREPERRDGVPRRARDEVRDQDDQRGEHPDPEEGLVEAPTQGVRARARWRRRRSRSRPFRARRRRARRRCDRASPPTALIGASQEVFRFGPVGPLKNARCSSPQRPGESDPREVGERGGRVARDGLHDGAGVVRRRPRVVAADAFRARRSEVEGAAVEVRVRAGRRIDDRVVADAIELRIVPGGALGALVLAVAGLGRLLLQRLGRGGRVEVELDHLPVAFVRVVPVVEDVVEPVLQRELAGPRGLGRDVRVDGRLRALRDAVRPVLVVAAGVERVAGEVEVVLVARGGEIVGRRRDLDEVAAPGPPQRDGRLVEQDLDVDRIERLPASRSRSPA